MSWRGGNAQYLDTLESADAPVRDHFVYTMLGADDVVLYVGCTRRPEMRWREHRYDSSRQMMAQTVACKMYGPYDYFTARRIERQKQDSLRPKFGRF